MCQRTTLIVRRTYRAELGIANSVHAHEELDAAADEWADRIDRLPAHVATMMKPLLRTAADATWETAIALEEFTEPQCFTNPPHRDAVEEMLAKGAIANQDG